MGIHLAVLIVLAVPGEAPERIDVPGGVLLTAAWFRDERTGVVAGGTTEDGPAVLLRTADGGESWQDVAPPVNARLYDVHQAAGRLWAVGLAGTVLCSGDDGLRWEPVPFPERAWLASVFFLDARHGFVAGGGAEGLLLFETRDGGHTWHPARDRVPEDGRGHTLRDLCFVDAETGFAAGDGGLLLRTRDGGLRWSRIELATGAWLRALAFQDRKHGIVAGAAGTLFETRDGGASFTPLALERELKLNAAAFGPGGALYLTAMEGKLLRRPAPGQPFEEVLAHERALTAMHVLPGGTLLVVGDGGFVASLPP